MLKGKEKDLLRLNASMPSGSKKRYVRSKSSKKKDLDVTPTKRKKTTTTTILPPAQVRPAQYDVQEAQNVVFKPNPGPQTEFLASSEREVLYGGAAGGGK